MADHISYMDAITDNANNAGKILVSTLWNQSGTIYVSVNNKQTALTGYSYNQYCPTLTVDSSSRTLTGCTNTADSQILYYWIEKGYNFTFTITSEDYFQLNDGSSIQYHVSDTPSLNEGNLTALNSILASTDRIGNGNFIAALNFYCGVKNHSKYGTEGTSTSWSYGDYTNGKSSKAFVAAGFDSYHLISRDYNSTFFDNSGLTDTAFSVIRENLDYGEIIEISVPGHAIFLDGYRWNDQTKEYEYHLNYGWGIWTSATNWYTVSQLRTTDSESMYAYVMAITFDLSPDIMVNVTNSRNDYWGGSFLRGVERINSIQNEKNTVFAFDSSIAGESIELNQAFTVKSAVGLDFQNLNVELSTTSKLLISSSQLLKFELTGGSLTVNASNADTVVEESGNQAVTLSLDSSYVYIGNYIDGISGLNTLLRGDNLSYKDLDNSFYASVNGNAVTAGSADDQVRLSNKSAIFGNLTLGGGNNFLSVESGSLFYGGFSAETNSLHTELYIGEDASTGPMIFLKDSTSENSFFSASGGELNVTVNELLDQNGSYVLYQGTNSGQAQNFTVNLFIGDKQYVLNKYHLSEDNYSLICENDKISLGYQLSSPEVLSVTADINTITNEDVTLTATFSGNSKNKYYSFDGQDWLTYNDDTGVVVTENGTVYFKSAIANLESTIVTFTVNWIDKTPPEKPVITQDITAPTNQSVTLTAVFSTDTAKKEYSMDGKEWLTYPDGTGIKVEENCVVFFRAADELGNSVIESYEVTNIDKTPPEKPSVSADIIKPTNQDVTLTAVFSNDTATKQFSTDGNEWQTYPETGVVVSANGTFYFRGLDEIGNISEVTSFEVSNIDKTPPEKPSVSADIIKPTNQDVTLTAVFSNDTATKQFSTDGSEWQTYPESGVVVSANGIVYFRGIDEAGNVSEVTTFEVNNIIKTAPDAPTVSADITEPTNQDVTLTAVYSNDIATKQYSTDGTEWQTYPESGVVVSANAIVYFRGIDEAGNISEVTSFKVSNIDKTAPEKPTVSADINTPTNQDVTLTAVYSNDTATKQYSTDGNEWKTYPESGVVVSANGTVYFRGLDEAGNISEVTSFEVTNITKTVPDAPTVSADITAPTNQNVTLTAVYSNNTVTKQYSTDGNEWQTYPESGVVVSENGTVYFRGIDEAGNVSSVTSFDVSNIDKTAPEKPTVTADITAPTDQNVTLTAVFSNDTATKQYSTDGNEWKTYPESGVVVSENGTVYFRGLDEAGNISEVSQYEVTNINKTAPDAPTVSASTTAPTNRDVTLTAVYSSSTVTKQYSTDGTEWQTYPESGVVVSANGTVYFRGLDEAGKASSVTTFEVTNIDKTAPDLPTVTADITQETDQDVTLTAVFSADTATKQYSFDQTNWETYPDSGVVVSENCTVYFRGIDEAGNVSGIRSYVVANIIRVDKDAPVKVYSSGVLAQADRLITETTLEANHVNSMFVSRGGEARNTTVNSAGMMYISNGGLGFGTEINSKGILYVSNGGTARQTTVNNAGRMSVSSGGTALETTLHSSGLMYVQPGGSASGVTVESAGGLYASGGKVLNAEINAAGRMYVTSGGTGYGTVVNSKGYLFVSNGGYLEGGSVSTNARLQIGSGGTAFGLRNAGGEILVQNHGLISSAEIADGAVRITAATAADLTMENGRLYISSGGIADGISTTSAARLYVSSGGKLTGSMNFARETAIQVQSGGIIDFDIAAAAPDTAVPVDSLTVFGGVPTYTITVSENQTFGLYTLVSQAAGFSGSMTIGTETASFGTLTPGGTSCVSGDTVYSLAFDTTKLVLSIKSTQDADMSISVSADPTALTNQNVTVTAVFGKDIAVREYSLDNATWQSYTAGVVMTENGIVYFRGFDSAMNPSEVVDYEVTNIDKIPPAKPVASADITEPTDQAVTVTAIFDDDSVLDEYSLDSVDWNIYSGGIVFTVNGSVFFRSSDAAGNVSDITEFTVSNIIPVTPDRVAGDLNADGRADIVMTVAQDGHPSDGSTGAWLIQNDQTAAWSDLSQRESGWEIFGTGRTVTDKNTDDVYLKSMDNVIGAWTTDGDGKVSGWETIGEFSSDTEIVGLGDFNGNGQTDLLLRNTNGAVGCFFTGGETTGWNYFQSLGDEWKLSAIGDLNGDGRDDVVLKHDAGFAGSWLTQADGTMAWADLDTLQEGFAIIGAGDFNGDGTDDVLLKNGSYYGAWLVNDGNAAGWMGLGDLGDVTVEQIADFNGDGTDDLRIRTSAGDLGAQLVMGEDDLVWKYYGSVGTEWKTAPAALA